MPSSVIRDYLDRLVERPGWREIGKGYEYLGLYRGVTVHAVAYGVQLRLLFHAPKVDLGEEKSLQFQGFRHWAAAGLPTAWLEGRGGDDHSCLVRIDRARLQEIGLKRFLRLPDLIADDLQAHGAPPHVTCERCGAQPATVAALVHGEHMAVCASCWQQLQDQASAQSGAEVRWRRVIPITLIINFLGLLTWGYLRQEQADAVLLFMTPCIYGLVLGSAIGRTGTGFNPALRVILFAAVVLVIMAGNVWGLRTDLVIHNGPVSWAEVWRQYFTVQLSNHLDQELPYLIGGVLGLWIGLAWLKPFEKPLLR